MSPFEGMTVLDFTQFTSGPVCTYILADFGADVYKLENPPLGDNNHYNAPSKNKHTVYITSLNHNKKSVLMNMKDPDQKSLFLKMVETADLVIDNFKAGTLEKFGITYEVLSKINPKVVWTSISGFGQTGPWSSRAAYDITIQAASGLCSGTGELGGSGVKAGISMSDFCSGLYSCCGTLAALLDAKRTGKGRRLDMGMIDSSFTLSEQFVARYYLLGQSFQPMGREHMNFVPYNSYACMDQKELLICVRSDEQFAALCSVLGISDFAVDKRYATNRARLVHREEVNAVIATAVSAFEYGVLAEKLMTYGIPCGKINNVDEVVKMEQVEARNMMVTAKYEDGTTCKLPGCPIKLSNFEDKPDRICHTLGQDTIEVLSKYADQEYVHKLYDPVLAETAAKWAEKAARLD